MASKKKAHGAGESRERRGGTSAKPYQRADGTSTRATTVHLTLDLHRRLRHRAVEEDRKLSAVVADAIEEYLDRRS